MESHTIFILVLLVILVVIVAHVFACERVVTGSGGQAPPAPYLGGADPEVDESSNDITQYFVPTS